MSIDAKKTTIACLLTCFNRKSKTLACLDSLQNQTLPENFELSVYLVDDGSTDGTSEAVNSKYPEVNIIEGTGSLYWNGGMRVAWQEALKKHFEYYLWVNDDIALAEDALKRMIECYREISYDKKNVGAIVGTFVDFETNKPTYGGRRIQSKITPLNFSPVLKPKEIAQECDVINGNLVLVTELATKSIGILSDKYTHGFGDHDYSLRLKKAGLSCWVAPGIFGSCSHNPIKGTFRDKSLSVSQRLKLLNPPVQVPPANETLFYIRHHGGPLWPVFWVKSWLADKLPLIKILMN